MQKSAIAPWQSPVFDMPRLHRENLFAENMRDVQRQNLVPRPERHERAADCEQKTLQRALGSIEFEALQLLSKTLLEAAEPKPAG